MSNELERARKKLIAYRRAERRLQIALDNVDWELDVLRPEVEQMGAEAARLSEIPTFELVDETED